MKTKTVKIPIYYGTLVIYMMENEEDERAIETKHNMTFIKDWAAFTFRKHVQGYTSYYMAFRPDNTTWDIAHECFHILNFIFEDRGIEHSTSNDEPAAYLLGWIMKQATQFMDKNKPK